MRLPAVLTLALLGRGVTAQTAQLPADLSDEAALREVRDQWFEIVKRVPREGLDPCRFLAAVKGHGTIQACGTSIPMLPAWRLATSQFCLP